MPNSKPKTKQTLQHSKHHNSNGKHFQMLPTAFNRERDIIEHIKHKLKTQIKKAGQGKHKDDETTEKVITLDKKLKKLIEKLNEQYLHKILKTKLNPSMIQLTRFIMIQLKNMIFRMKRFLRYYRIQKTVLQSILTGLPYMISTELLYGILRIYQPHLLLRKAGLHKQKIISKQFIMDQRSSSILIK